MTINNEQLRRDVDALKTDNALLRTNADAMMNVITQQNDEIAQLTTLLDKVAVNNGNQIQQISFQSSEIAQLKTENQQLKVSHRSRIT